MLKKIIYSGLNGAARAARDLARRFGIPHESFYSGIQKAVLNSDGTLIISLGESNKKSKIIKDFADKNLKPRLHISLGKTANNSAVKSIFYWVEAHEIDILHIAGSCGGNGYQIYQGTLSILTKLMAFYIIADDSRESLKTGTNETNTVRDFVDEIISELSLKDKVLMTYIDETDITIMGRIFDKFIRGRNNPKLDDEKPERIMHEIWKRLRESDRIRAVN